MIIDSHWYGIDVCIKCYYVLSKRQINHSGGICPTCGYSSFSETCTTQKLILKKKRYDKWWEFWKKKEVSYTGLDDFTKNWLKSKTHLLRRIE